MAGAFDDESGSCDQHEQVRYRLHAPAPGLRPRSQAGEQEDERSHRGAEYQERRQAPHEARRGEAEDRDRGQTAMAAPAVSLDLAPLVRATVEEGVMRHGDLLVGQQCVHVLHQGLEIGAADDRHHRVHLGGLDAVGA